MDSKSTAEHLGVPAAMYLRLEVEAFLFEEAAALDDWRLDDWAALFAEDGRYIVPATDARDGDASTTLVLLEDDTARIRGRVTRLKSRRAHREFPWSRTRRLITNVRILDVRGDLVEATANFAVYRYRNQEEHTFVGKYLYQLVRDGGSFKIRLRRAELDLEALRPHGSISIIL